MSAGVIFITRAAEEAAATALAVEALGFTALCAPISAIRDTDIPLPAAAFYQGLIFSSANGVRAFMRRSLAADYLQKPVYAVGDHTQEVARANGFTAVSSAAGGMADLAAMLRTQVTPPVRLLHGRGQDMREDPAAFLPRSAGWLIDGITLYRAAPAAVDEAMLARIRNSDIDAVLFYSSRSAKLFGQAFAGIDFTRTKAFCLADSVLESLDIKQWAELRIAAHPDQSGMMALVRALKTEARIMQTQSTPESEDDSGALANAESVIERFGGIRPMATKMDVPVTTVQGWKKRNVIPGNRREDVMSAARAHNIDLSDIVANQNQADQAEGFSATLNEASRAAASDPAIEKINRQATADPVFQPGVTREDMMREIKKSETVTIRKSVLAASALLTVFVIAAALLVTAGRQKLQQTEERVAVLEQQSPEAPKGPGFFTRMMDELRGRVDAVEASVNSLKGQAETLSGGLGSGSITQRLSALENKLQTVTGSSPDLSAVVSRFSTPQQMEGAVAELKTLIGGLQGRVDGMDEELVKQQDANTELGQALEGVSPKELKAAAMLIGLNQFRDSLNRSEPFGDDLAMMQGMVGKDDPELNDAIAKLAPYAEKGVLSPAGLSDELKGLTGDIVVASVQGQDVSVQDKAMARFQKLVSIEKDGKPVMGNNSQAVVAEAQTMLNAGDVEGATQKLQTLQGPAREKAQPVIDQAQVTMMAQKVKGMLSGTIINQIKSAGHSAPLTAKTGLGNIMGPGGLNLPPAPKVE